MDTPSPGFNKGRLQNVEGREHTKNYWNGITPENYVKENENSHDLGLRMPVLEHSPPKLPSLEDLMCGANPGRRLPVPPRRQNSNPCHQEIDHNPEEEEEEGKRWSRIMSTPLNSSVRHESKMKMPSPQLQVSPKELLNKWRGSVGLYDEMGFLKSSPTVGGKEGGSRV